MTFTVRFERHGEGATPRFLATWVVGITACLTAAVAALSSCILFQGRTGDRILFPLEPHAEWIEDCGACHEDVATHDVTPEVRRALEKRCLECHAERAQDCSYCHTDVSNAGRFPERERHLAFSHLNHLVRTSGDCAVCHPGAHGGESSELAALHPTALPAHEECFSCHQMQGFYDRLECRNCHEELLRYGLKPHDAFAHTADWVHREHALFVQSTETAATCAQCHDATFCSDCHFEDPVMRLWERSPEKVSRRFIHPGDYVFRHTWDVRADAASCLRCHSESWCSDCHESRGIADRTAPQGFSYHSSTWLLAGASDFHGDAARRDILSCAVCHTGTSGRGDCVACHQVGGFGGNPHPPGFESKLSRTGAPVCRLCHVR